MIWPFKPKPEPHQHRWKVIGTQLGRTAPEFGGYARTAILRMCDCGEFCTTIVDGHWTVEQLSQASGADQEIAELRKMAGLK